MSKYIIEIKPEYEDKFKGVMILGAENSNLYVDSNTVDELEELTADYINEHFGSLQDDAYKRGLEEGKAQAERGCKGCEYEGKTGEHLPCEYCKNNFRSQWTAKDDRIEVGDEVIYNGTTKCIVVRPEDDERYASLIDSDGTHYSADHRECKKTGRHFDIPKILEDMRHD